MFSRRGLEKNPTLDVKLSLEGRPESSYGVRRPGLSPEDALTVGALLSRIQLLADTEGLIVEVHIPLENSWMLCGRADMGSKPGGVVRSVFVEPQVGSTYAEHVLTDRGNIPVHSASLRVLFAYMCLLISGTVRDVRQEK